MRPKLYPVSFCAAHLALCVSVLSNSIRRTQQTTSPAIGRRWRRQFGAQKVLRTTESGWDLTNFLWKFAVLLTEIYAVICHYCWLIDLCLVSQSFNSSWYPYESSVAAGRASGQSCSCAPVMVLPWYLNTLVGTSLEQGSQWH